MKQLKFTSADGYKATSQVWDEVKKPKAILLLVHNLKESLQFYTPVAEFFNEHNYVVCASMLRFHEKGKNGDGDLNDTTDFFKENANDIYLLAKMMTESFHAPLFVVGVGFSAYLVKRFLEICDLATGAVLIGAGFHKSLLYKTIQPLGFALHMISRKKQYAKQIEHFMFAPLNAKFENNNYITTSDVLYEKISKSENFTNLLPVNYYYSFLNNIVQKDKNLTNISKNINLLLLSGANDPINTGKHLIQMQLDFEKVGVACDVKVLEGFRQNVLLEPDNAAALKEILSFCNKTMK